VWLSYVAAWRPYFAALGRGALTSARRTAVALSRSIAMAWTIRGCEGVKDRLLVREELRRKSALTRLI
jgi:hypothetical protein